MLTADRDQDHPLVAIACIEHGGVTSNISHHPLGRTHEARHEAETLIINDINEDQQTNQQSVFCVYQPV